MNQDNIPSRTSQTVPTIASSPQSSSESKGPPKRDIIDTETSRQPFYLRKDVLMSLAVFCAAGASTIEILLAISASNHGLGSGEVRLYYLWTYGPTAILTALGAVWNRVDFQVKMLAPWWRMTAAKDPLAADNSISLDYIDLWFLWALLKACRNRDWIVVLTIGVKILLLLATVFSTSVFSRDTFQLPGTAVIELQSRLENNGMDLGTARDRAFVAMLGFVNNSWPLPDGTTKHLVRQTYQRRDQVSLDSDIPLSLDAVSVDMHCKAAKLDWFRFGVIGDDGTETGQILRTELSISDDTCQLDFLSEFSMNRGPSIDSDAIGWLGHTIGGRYWVGRCAGPSNATTTDDRRLRLGLILLESQNRYTWSNKDNVTYQVITGRTVKRSTQLICSLSLEPSVVEVILSRDNVSSEETIQTPVLKSSPRGSNLPALRVPTNTQLMDTMGVLPIQGAELPDTCGRFAYLEDYCDFNRPPPGQWSPRLGLPPTLDKRLLLALLLYDSSTPSPDSLFNPDLMLNITTRFFQSFAIQILNKAAVIPASQTVAINGTLRAYRVLVSATPGHFVATLLFVSALLALGLMAWLKRDPMRRAGIARIPNSTWNIIMLMTEEQASLRALTGMAGQNMSALAINRRQLRFRLEHTPNEKATLKTSKSSISDYFLPRLKSLGGNTASEADKRLHVTSLPIVIRPTIRIACLLLGVGIIIGLQIMFVESQRMEGLAEAPVDGSIMHYLWSFGPVTTCVLFSTYHGAVDFTTRSLQPFQAMLDPMGATFSSSIGLNLLDRSLPGVILTALRTRSFSVLFTTLASLVASFLTGFSAALFIERSYPVPMASRLFPIDLFAPYLLPGEKFQYGGSIAALLMGLERESPYPRLTYQDLVFHDMAIMPSGQDTTRTLLPTDDFNTTGVVPALQPRLSCRLYDSTSIEVNYNQDMALKLSAHLLTESSGGRSEPSGQAKQNPNNHRCFIYSKEFEMKDMYDGVVFGLGGVANDHMTAPAIDDNNLNRWGCLSEYVYIWGHYSNTTTTGTNLWALGCNETIDVVKTMVHFTGGSKLQINPDKPPEVIANITSNQRNLLLRPNSTMVYSPPNSQTLVREEDIYLSYLPALTQDSPQLSQFFGILTNSRFGIPLTALKDPSQAEAVVSAIKLQHGIIRAQSLNTDYRRPSLQLVFESAIYGTDKRIPLSLDGYVSDDLLAVRPYNVTVTAFDGPRRIVQVPESTIILQSLFGVIVLFSAAGWLLQPKAPGTPSSRVFSQARAPKQQNAPTTPKQSPVSSTSIVGTMALLEDSNIFETMTQIRSKRNGDIQAERKAMSDYRFKLGWKEGPAIRTTFTTCKPAAEETDTEGPDELKLQTEQRTSTKNDKTQPSGEVKRGEELETPQADKHRVFTLIVIKTKTRETSIV